MHSSNYFWEPFKKKLFLRRGIILYGISYPRIIRGSVPWRIYKSQKIQILNLLFEKCSKTLNYIFYGKINNILAFKNDQINSGRANNFWAL